MYPHKCHEPLAPYGPSGAHNSSPSLSPLPLLTLSLFPSYALSDSRYSHRRLYGDVGSPTNMHHTWTRGAMRHRLPVSTKHWVPEYYTVHACAWITHTHKLRDSCASLYIPYIYSHFHINSRTQTRTIALHVANWQRDALTRTNSPTLNVHVKVLRHMGDYSVLDYGETK